MHIYSGNYQTCPTCLSFRLPLSLSVCLRVQREQDCLSMCCCSCAVETLVEGVVLMMSAWLICSFYK